MNASPLQKRGLDFFEYYGFIEDIVDQKRESTEKAESVLKTFRHREAGA